MKRTPQNNSASAVNYRKPAADRRRPSADRRRPAADRINQAADRADSAAYRSKTAADRVNSSAYRSKTAADRTNSSAYRTKSNSNNKKTAGYSGYRNTASTYKKKKVYRKKKRRSKVFLIIFPILAVFLAFIVFVGVKVSLLKNQASSIKDDLELVIECVSNQDINGAETALEKSRTDSTELKNMIADPFWTAASSVQRIDDELSAGKDLLGVLDSAQDDLLDPLLALLKEKPMTALKVGDSGFNVKLINSYLDFLESVRPQIDSIISQITSIDTDSIMGSYVANAKDKILTYMEIYEQANEFLPLVRNVLGSGEDKLYLLVAQNSAEVRASGGFPGSIGAIKITNGILTIGDFQSVYNVLSDTISDASGVTDEELTLFGSWVYAPRDACFIPAFDKAAKIWAVAYEDKQRENGAQDHYDDETTDTEYTDDSWYDDSWYDNSWEDNSWEDSYDTGSSSYAADSGINRLTYYLNQTGAYEIQENTDGYGYGNSYTTHTATSNPDRASEADYYNGIYNGDGGIYYIFNNDFYGYNTTTSEYVRYVDGVISLTPAIIQSLLKEIGEVTLSDGTKLNGDNATKVLQHDLYHKYFDEETITSTSNSQADKLFAQTAKKVMKEFVSNFKISKLTDYYKLFQDGIKKNIIMMWMKDETSESMIEKLGASGKLNSNPEEPFTGAYFSLADPSKMGWYLDMDTTVSDTYVTNYDGTKTYDVSVTLRNVITQQDIQNSSWYIIGNYSGGIRGFLHLFAPSGGTITDVETSNGTYALEGTYGELNVAYNLDLLIQPGESLTFNYKITTGSSSADPLKIVTTPLLTEYR